MKILNFTQFENTSNILILYFNFKKIHAYPSILKRKDLNSRSKLSPIFPRSIEQKEF